MGATQCCENDTAPPDLRVEKPIKRGTGVGHPDQIEGSMSGFMTVASSNKVSITSAECRFSQLGNERPALGYWNIRGLAQQIRFLLTYLEVDYDDVSYTQGDWPNFSNEEWENEKHELSLDFPNLPFYIDQDVRLTETLAILKYISVRYQPSLLGKTPEEQGMVEMLAHIVNELNKQASVPCYFGEKSKSDIGDNLLKNIKPIVQHLEVMRTKFLIADYITYVDFMLFELCERIAFLTDGRLFEQEPLLQRHNQEIVMLPKILNYMQSDVDFKGRLFNNKVARINNHPKIQIEYFGMNGRADMLIQMLAFLNIPYEKLDVTFEEWQARKVANETGEMGGLPIVYYKGIQMQQAGAVLRSWGVENGLYPVKDWQAAGKIDEIVACWSDVLEAFAPVLLNAAASADERKQAIEEVKEGILRKFLKMIETQLEKNINNSKFVVGEKMSIADFCLACLTFNILKNESGPFQAACAPLLLEFPHYGAYSKRLQAELKEHLEARPVCPF